MSWPIDDSKADAQPVALAHRGELARLALEPRPLQRQRDLVEQIVEQRQLVVVDRAHAVVAGQADGGEHRLVRAHRIEQPFGRLQRDVPPRPPARRTRCVSAAAAMSLGVSSVAVGLAGDEPRLGRTGHQHSVAVEQPAQARAQAMPAISSSPLHDSRRRARPAMVALRAAWAAASARLAAHPRGELAGHQRDQEQDDDGHDVGRAGRCGRCGTAR